MTESEPQMVLKRLWRWSRGRKAPPRAIWEGFYRSFDEIPAAQAAFDTGDAIAAAEQLLEEIRGEPFPAEAELDHQILALLVRARHGEPVRVLDIAGGLGQSYAALRRMVGDASLHYEVVELTEVASRGAELWRDDPAIRFVDEATALLGAHDVVFSKGYLQYSADFAETLRRWFGAGAEWILLEKVPVVSCATYATVQIDVYGARLPYWMINADDLRVVATASGYRLVLQRRLERVYDQSTFPSELRMERASSLLFQRVETV